MEEKDNLIAELQIKLQKLETENNHLKSQLNKMGEIINKQSSEHQTQILHNPYPPQGRNK